MTLAQIVQECQQSGIFAAHWSRIPAQKVPILSKEGEYVGFYAPLTRDGVSCMGFVYIAQAHRRQGYALEALKEFLRTQPRATWYAAADNLPAQRLAEKACMRPRDRQHYDNQEYIIYAL